jgi:hypothetical protein
LSAPAPQFRESIRASAEMSLCTSSSAVISREKNAIGVVFMARAAGCFVIASAIPRFVSSTGAPRRRSCAGWNPPVASDVAKSGGHADQIAPMPVKEL